MQFELPPGCSLGSAAIGYVLHALAASDSYDYVPVDGLPADTIAVPAREALVAITCSAPPLFRNALACAAKVYRRDVVLLRIDEAPDAPSFISIEVALGASSFAPFIECDLSLWRDDHSTWLVPTHFGPSISITPAGFNVEIVPPYSSLAERNVGVARAQREILRLAFPGEVAA